MRRCGNTQKGFTLVELAIVYLAIGILMTAGFTLLHDYLKLNEVKTTKNRMQVIEAAITSFYNANGRLPCVASLTDTETAGTFGTESVPDCSSGATPAGTFKRKGSTGSNKVRVGAIPVRTLNLPDQDMTDAWNNRFVYAVSGDLASTIAATVASGSGAITVQDSGGNDVALPSGTAQYVLLSLGQDGVGAYSADGKLETPCSAGVVESPNCTMLPSSGTATFIKTTLTSTAGGASEYDDFVDFASWTGNNGAVPSGAIMILDNPGPSAPSPSCAGGHQHCCPSGWNDVTNSKVPPLKVLGAGSFVFYCQKN